MAWLGGSLLHVCRAVVVSDQLSNSTFFNRTYGTSIGAVLNYAWIKVMNTLIKKIALYFNDLENHRTFSNYEDSLILKVFAFQFCNRYAAGRCTGRAVLSPPPLLSPRATAFSAFCRAWSTHHTHIIAIISLTAPPETPSATFPSSISPSSSSERLSFPRTSRA